jgi:gluconate 2-dehydrogenase gamma chain
MRITQLTRRRFVADASRAASGGWLALQLPWIAALASCAREDATDDRAFASLTSLTPPEARGLRAFAAQIIPSDDGTPGADEAGAVYFVDRALGMPFFADSVPIIRAGLADLDARARALHANDGFASLTAAQQVAVIRQIEHEPFFSVARMLVVVGTFADPAHGGNRGGAGWTMIGIDHRPTYSAPFGWYDRSLGGTPPRDAA